MLEVYLHEDKIHVQQNQMKRNNNNKCQKKITQKKNANSMKIKFKIFYLFQKLSFTDREIQ